MKKEDLSLCFVCNNFILFKNKEIMIQYLIKVKTVVLFLATLIIILTNTFIFRALKVDFGNNSVEDTPKIIIFILVVFFAPFFETLVFNLLPVKLMQYLTRSTFLIIFTSSFAFALIHIYSIAYLLMTYIGGIFLNTLYLVFEKKHGILKAFLLIISLHSIYNLIGFILMELRII